MFKRTKKLIVLILSLTLGFQMFATNVAQAFISEGSDMSLFKEITTDIGKKEGIDIMPMQAFVTWLDGPDGELCGWSEHPFTLNWYEDFNMGLPETVTITIPKKAAFLVSKESDIVFKDNGNVKKVSNLEFSETATEKIMTFKVEAPGWGSLCTVDFNLRTPLVSKEMTVTAKVGNNLVPTNPLGDVNFVKESYAIRPGLTIDTTADIILKDMKFDVFGLAVINCEIPDNRYRLTMQVYESNEKHDPECDDEDCGSHGNGQDMKPVYELSWVIDSEVPTNFGYIDGRDYRFTDAMFPNTYKDGYYTIRVSFAIEMGIRNWQLIDYVEKDVLFRKYPPQAPKIIRTPENPIVGQPVTIKASYVDPEGVPIHYEWIGRDSETMVYTSGRHVVQVRAIDAFGLESPWTADLFIATNADGSDGMVLRSADSHLHEPGIEGYTISSYVFTVPPVKGHVGKDHGKVEGLNKGGVWEQVNYGTTKNGITLTGSLPKGKFTQLRFYYYTNHTCMYNKSNITYSVKFDYIDTGGSVDGTTPVNSINIVNAISSMDEHNTLQLITEVLPASATDKSLSWTSSNPNVASVSADGMVIALKSGSTNITATSNSTPSITKSFRLDVFAPTNIVRVNGIEVSYEDQIITSDMIIKMSPGDISQLNAEVMPSNAYDQDLIFTSDNINIVNPNKDGFVGYLEAVSIGMAEITVKSEQGNGPSLTFYVDVAIPVESLTLSDMELTLDVGENYLMTATINPNNATHKGINWSSDDIDVVTVDANGRVTAVGEGTATITATSIDNPNATDSCVVEVNAAPFVEVTSISVNQSSMFFLEGEMGRLRETVQPANATNKAVIFQSADTNVAVVNQSGYVTAVGSGTTVISVISVSNSDIIANVDVEVMSLSFEATTISEITIIDLNTPEHSKTTPGYSKARG